MKKYKYILTAILSFFILLPNIIYANCTEEEIEHFKEVEEGYKYTYEFNKEKMTYDVIFYETEKSSYEYKPDFPRYVEYEELDDIRTAARGLKPGEYNIKLIGRTETCDFAFKDETLKLSEFNNYSEDPLCEGIEEFVLCQPTYDKNITYEEFVDRVNIYKKTKKEKQEETKEKDKVAIVSFIKDNLIKIIAIVIFVAALVVTAIFTAKSIRKSRRLE